MTDSNGSFGRLRPFIIVISSVPKVRIWTPPHLQASCIWQISSEVDVSDEGDLSTALGLQITIKDGQIQQSNFHDYPLARMASFPSNFEAHILPYDDSPTGVGEIGIATAAPALTIFAATGKRIRRLPILNQLKGQALPDPVVRAPSGR